MSTSSQTEVPRRAESVPELDLTDVSTLAAWCSRSGESYNIGAWQASLLLSTKEFRIAVADTLAAMDLPDDHPARLTWERERTRPSATAGASR